MRKILALLAVFSLQTVWADEVKRDVFVPNEKTAIAIAKAILIPMFGENFDEDRARQTFSKTHNFYATLYQDTWVVEDAPPSRLSWSEPILRVEIERKRGRIKKVSEY